MGYSTKDIVRKIANYIKKETPDLLQYNSFNEWIKKFRQKEEEYKNIFPIEVHKNFPLHEDVIKLIVKELFSIMPFSKFYVLQNYEKHLNGIDYLIYPSKNPMKEKYIKIIQSLLNEFNIDKSKTFTVGGSMGGYAAIFYAISMKLKGAIAIHPQITYKATRKHKTDEWEKKIKSCGSQFYDLTDYLFKYEPTPFLYLEYGIYEADKEAEEELITSFLKRQAFIIIRKTANPKYITTNPSKQTIASIIKFFENTGFTDEYIK